MSGQGDRVAEEQTFSVHEKEQDLTYGEVRMNQKITITTQQEPTVGEVRMN